MSAIDRARETLALSGDGRPRCIDVPRILGAVEALLLTDDEAAIREVLLAGFLRDSAERYHEHVAPHLRSFHDCQFEMGTHEARIEHFCGESPRHPVILSPYLISDVPVSNRLYALLDRRRLEVAAVDLDLPVTGVTWFDARLFAMWMGCRLPTEAEWEFACGGGSNDEWSCGDERLLHRFAWYSENAGGIVHPIATLEPTRHGLFDLHGNVWEWCQDVYDQDFYGRSPIQDPVCTGGGRSSEHRVCRGGSVHALAEMCRTRYRCHDPVDFRASDLGFRLAASDRG